MNYAWMCPIVVREGHGSRSGPDRNILALRRFHDLREQGGQRVANEKLAYNEMAQVSSNGTARVPIRTFVDRGLGPAQPGAQRQRRGYGRFIVPPGTDDAHVIKGATLAALSEAIGERLARYAQVTVELKLAPDFETLAASIQRFNGFAASGGIRLPAWRASGQHLFNGAGAPSPSAPSPTMFRSRGGTLLRGAADRGTSIPGRPKTDVLRQVLDDQDKPIAALRGRQLRRLGFARAYSAGGATIGRSWRSLTWRRTAHKERKARRIG